jgi:hypothetical protein
MNVVNSTSEWHPTAVTSSNAASKLVPPHVPIPPSFLRVLPVEPWLTGDCRVDFVDPTMSLCTILTGNRFLDSIAFDVAIRLLEHRFECDAKHLKRNAFSKEDVIAKRPHKCFWVSSTLTTDADEFQRQAGEIVWPVRQSGNDTRSNVVYLLPFLWSDYYSYITVRERFRPEFCYTYSSSTSGQVFASDVVSKNFTLDQEWRGVLEKARYCDYIVTESPEVLVLADAMQIPCRRLVRTNSSQPLSEGDVTNPGLYSISRYGYLANVLDRLNYDAAHAVVATFPFSLFQTVDIPISKTATTADNDSTNKTLVVIIGSLRGGEMSWQSMYKHLLDENNADLALMIGEGGNKSLTPYLRAKYVWEFPEYEDWADAIDQIDGPEWRTTVQPAILKKCGILGGVTGYIGSGAIIFMARHWLLQRIDELKLLEVYDRIVLTRSDFFYKCPHRLGDLDPRYLWVPSGEDYGGISDRHWIMNKYHVQRALNIFESLVKLYQYLLSPLFGQNPELLVRFCWTIENIFPHQVRRFPRVQYTGYVAGVDHSRWEQSRRRGRSEDGLNLKYKREYLFAKCHCDGGHVYDPSSGHNFSEGIYTNNAYQEWECKS